MIAFLQFLIAFLLSQELPAPTRPAFDPGGALIVMGVYGGAAAIMSRWFRYIAAREPERALPFLGGAANLARLAALGTFYAVAQTYGWCRAPERLGVESWVLVPHLVRLVPFFLLAGAGRAAIHAAAVAARIAPSLGRALLMDAKLSILPVAPIVILSLFSDVTQRVDRTTWWGRIWVDYAGLPTVQTFLMLGVVVVGLLVIPSVLRRVWRCRPLPAGPLRDRLEAYSRRVGFRAREILVWPTGGDHLNAAVVGVLPRFRYVFITDGLLDTLEADEIEAVFAHEAGHARRGHLLLFFGYTSVLALAGFLPEAVLGPIETLVAPVPVVLRVVLVIVLWFGLIFGWISRRFEQEADVYGLDTLPPPLRDAGDPAPAEMHPFARALDRIAEEAGGIREVTGWRHYSIAERVDFVRSYLADERVRRTFRLQMLAIRGTLLALVLLTGGAAALRVPFDLGESRSQQMIQELVQGISTPVPAARAEHLSKAARAADRSGRTDDALRWYAESVALGAPPEALRDYAALLEKTGRLRGAAAAWDDLAAREDAPAALRDAARGHAQHCRDALR